jgi:hypothetical protein
MPMSPQQRSAAAFKAAATKRRNAAARGFAPPPPRPRAPFNPPTPPVTNPWTAVNPPPPPPPVTPPPATPPPAARPTWLGKPKATIETQRATVLVALEDLFALINTTHGYTPERTKAFEKYQKVLTKALAPAHTVEMKNENATALLQAVLTLVRLTF